MEFESYGENDGWGYSYYTNGKPTTIKLEGTYHVEKGYAIISYSPTGVKQSNTSSVRKWWTLWLYPHKHTTITDLMEEKWGRTIKVLYSDRSITYKVGEEWVN